MVTQKTKKVRVSFSVARVHKLDMDLLRLFRLASRDLLQSIQTFGGHFGDLVTRPKCTPYHEIPWERE